MILTSRESELNENNLTELEVYKSNDDGVNWSLQGGTIDTSNKTLQLHGISSFSKWTAGGATSPDTWLKGVKPISNDTVIIYPGDTIFINSSKASCYYLLNEGIVYFKSASNQLSSTVSLFNNGTITGSSLGRGFGTE